MMRVLTRDRRLPCGHARVIVSGLDLGAVLDRRCSICKQHYHGTIVPAHLQTRGLELARIRWEAA